MRYALAITMAIIYLTQSIWCWAAQPIVSPEIFDQRPVEKYALILAAQDYNEFPPVVNAIDDAYAIASALHARNFNLVRVVTDKSTAAQFQFHLDAMAQLAQISNKPAVIFIYFAGHGFQDGPFSYIVPYSGSKGTSREGSEQLESLRDSSILVQNVLSMFKPGLGSFTAVFIDACRKNGPQGEGLPVVPGKQNAGAGLLQLATQPNQLAQSRSLSNPSRSPYSLALERRLATSPLSLANMLEKAGLDVGDNTEPPQIPDLINSSEAASEFYLVEPHPNRSIHLSLLQSIIKMENPNACLRKFLTRLPAGPFTRAAYSFFDETLQMETGTCETVDL